MNAAMRALAHDVDEFWAEDMGRRIGHGNLHYLLELPRKYRSAVRQRASSIPYDVIELNQPHAYLAALDHRRRKRRGVFVNRSHGHEVRSDESLDHWRRKLGVPPRNIVRKVPSWLIRRLLARQWDLTARSADGFIVSCTEDRDFLENRYRVAAGRIAVITQGVPEVFWSTPARSFDADLRNRMLYVGQYAFVKAPMVLARAVAMVLAAQPAATMTWVCNQMHHEDVRRLLPEDARHRITLCDWMPQEELIQVYDEHGIFLFPSFFEGFGKTPLEAMARGLCVIASETGGMRDYIDSGKNGFLVPLGRPDLVADRTVELMRDFARCRAMASAARETACRHSWDRCARDATAFYQQLIKQKTYRSG